MRGVGREGEKRERLLKKGNEMSGAPAENALRHTPLSGSALKLQQHEACSASIFDAMVLLSTYGVPRYCVKTVLVQGALLLLLCLLLVHLMPSLHFLVAYTICLALPDLRYSIMYSTAWCQLYVTCQCGLPGQLEPGPLTTILNH